MYKVEYFKMKGKPISTAFRSKKKKIKTLRTKVKNQNYIGEKDYLSKTLFAVIY